MTHRTSKIAQLSALIVAATAAFALTAGVVTAEPKRDDAAPPAKDGGKAGAKGAPRAKGAQRTKGAQGKRAGRVFKRFDANRDGSLQKSEVPERVWKRIGVADANGDQAISKVEFDQAHAQGKLARPQGGKRAHAGKGGKGRGAGGLFKRFDANQDGALQKGEVPAPVWQRISSADANQDASITKAELRQAHKDGKLKRPRGSRSGKARRG